MTLNNNKTIYNVIKKSINDYGKPIGIDTIGESAIPTTFKALVKYKKQAVQSSDYIIQLKDQYQFTMLNNVKINDYIYWNNAYYKVTSIDSTTDGVYKAYADFSKVVSQDNYTIQANDISLEKGNTTQLTPVCMKNEVQVSDAICNYSIGDSSIATCSDNGLVTTINEGNTTISISWEGITKTINITVISGATFKEFKFNYEEESEFEQGKTHTIKVVNEDGTDVDGNRIFNISIDTDSIDLGIVDNITTTNNSITFNLPSQRTTEYFSVSAYDVNFKDNILTKEFTSAKVY